MSLVLVFNYLYMTKNYKTKAKNITVGQCKWGAVTEIMLLDGVYYTPNAIWNMGMCACNVCGTIVPSDKKFCPYCNEWIMIIHEKHYRGYEPDLLPTPERHEFRVVFIDRAFRDPHLQKLFPNGKERWKECERIYEKYKSLNYGKQ